MTRPIPWIPATVLRTEDLAQGVRQITFQPAVPAPPFDPGAHLRIEAITPQGPILRHYTIVEAAPGSLAVAVKLHPNSRGGSAWIWTLHPGDAVRLTMPENRFPLSWRAPDWLLVAGGIGVTPILGMARALTAAGRPVRMIYGGRSRGEMAFVDDLAALLGDRLALREDAAGEQIDLAPAIAALHPEGEMYVCGPLGLLEAAQGAWAAAGRRPSRLRYEVFGDTGRLPDRPFTVTLAHTGQRVEVPVGQSLLSAIRATGVEMLSDCERGECGICAVKLAQVDGTLDHRDVFFSAHQRAEGRAMCSCVSRLSGGHAVIDIGHRAPS